MSRKEQIKQKRYELCNEASVLLKKHLQKNFQEARSEFIKRNELHDLREAKRSISETVVMATERVLRGKDESRDKPPSNTAKQNGMPVARIHDINAVDEPKGFGTGFLIAPNLLITNHHVFSSAEEALGCVANFQHELDSITNKILEGVSFKLRPDMFFYNFKDLDFALVYVEERSVDKNKNLNSLGFLPLIETKGKVKKDSPLNIIQYPQGGHKKYTTEDNFILEIDDNNGILYYTTDTQEGASGSPGFNDFWEVASLHYTSVPDTNEQGQWLNKKGEVWDKQNEKDINWIANAGKSISKIVEHLKKLRLEKDEQKFINAILNNMYDPLAKDLANESLSENHTNQNINTMEKTVMNFYGPATLNFGKEPVGPPVQLQNGFMNGKHMEGAAEKKERFDENYDDREGYNENFLEGFTVPMPSVNKKRDKELFKNFGASVPYIVPYHHYSLVMNKTRRMAMWTASNVDYSKAVRDNRERTELGNGAWRLDQRIPDKYQIQAAEFYDPATLVDKGHIVRRDDNCWAPRKNNKSDSLGIEYANADTFHWTNCTPQHEAFNRDMMIYKGVGKWGVLENAIKDQLDPPKNDANADDKDYGQRACVLAGPILDNENDPEYMDIQYPLKFWKVFAINSASAGKLVYGFILSQKDKIDEAGLEKEGKPRFNRMVKAMQVSLKKIERLTGVVFDETLHEYDVLSGIDNNEDDGEVELESNLSNFKAKQLSVKIKK